MADDHILYAQLLEHIGRDFAGERTGLLKVHILRANGNLGALRSLYSRLNIGKRYAENHLAPLGLGEQRLHLFDQCLCLARRLVHLPVTSNDGLAISAIHVKYPFQILRRNIIFVIIMYLYGRCARYKANNASGRASARPPGAGFQRYLSFRQAIPGSSRPSRNSSEAPPPVEMWVILSA